MSEKKSGAPIRLSSRTAVALRRSAGKVRLICQAIGIVMTAGLFALAVFLGFRWLPAVPIVVAFTAFFDVILYVHAERTILSLTSFALSAEQASRSLRAEAKEEARKKLQDNEEKKILKNMEDRFSSIDNPEGWISGNSLSSTQIISKETKKTSVRRIHSVVEQESLNDQHNNTENSLKVRHRRRNSNSKLTLIEGNKKG